MANHSIFRLGISLLIGISILSGCSRSLPDPPSAPVPASLALGNDSLLSRYLLEENLYTDAYFSQVDGLAKLLTREAEGRDITIPPGELPAIATYPLVSPNGKYRVYVDSLQRVRSTEKKMTAMDDPVLFAPDNQRMKTAIRFSASGKFLFIESSDKELTEIYFLPADLRSRQPVLIEPAQKGIRYEADHYGMDYFWIMTNLNAPDGRLVQARITAPGSRNWLPAVVYNDSTRLLQFKIIGQRYLLLFEEKDERAGIRISDLTALKDPSKENRIGFKDPGGMLTFAGYDEQSGKIRLLFSSPLTPPTMYTYDLANYKLGIRWQKKIKGFIRENYGSKVILLTIGPDQSIPVTLLFNKDLDKQDGTAPLLLLSVYNGFSESVTVFDPLLIPLLDRGFYIAMVPDDGKLLAETARQLIRENYTGKGLITAIGHNATLEPVLKSLTGSPNLFKAVILCRTTLAPTKSNGGSTPPAFPGTGLFTNQIYPPIYFSAGEAPTDRRYMAGLTAQARTTTDKKNILLLRSATNEQKTVSEPVAFIFHCYGLRK